MSQPIHNKRAERRFLFSAILLVITLSYMIVAQALDLDELSQRLNSSAVSGKFTQNSFAPGSIQPEVSQGDFTFDPPNHFRWEYLKPYNQLLVADGEKIWIYEPDLEQLTIKNQQANSGSLFQFFEQPEQLKKDFKVKKALDEKTLVLESTESDDQIKNITFVLSEHWLERIDVVDQYGQLTQIIFDATHVEKPASLLFEFKVPEGVDVIDETREQIIQP